MDRILLAIIGALSGLWRRIGAQPEHLLAILKVKTTLDKRRTSGMVSQTQKNKKGQQQSWLIYFFYFIFGGFFVTLIHQFEHTATGYGFYLFGWSIALAMALIADFTEVLLDQRDNYILMPRPVNSRTISLARLLHIFIYISRLMIAFGVAGFCYSIYLGGALGALVFVLQLLLTTLFTIFAVNLVYLLLLQYMAPQRMKQVIGGVQIAFTVLIFGAYYVLPRFLDLDQMGQPNILDYAISWAVPPFWIGAIWPVLIEGIWGHPAIVFAVLGLVVPFLLILVTIKGFSKHLNARLLALDHASIPTPSAKSERDQSATSLASRLGRFLPDRVHQAAFAWVWTMTGRVQEFKRRVYPSFAFVPFLFIYFAFDSEGTIAERFASIQESQMYLLLVYFGWMLLSSPWTSLPFYTGFRAAWMFRSAPLKGPGPILVGAFWAVSIKFFIPFFLLMTLVSTGVWGVKVLDDFLLGFFAILFLSLLIAKMNKLYLPFSAQPEEQQKGGNLVYVFLALLLVGALGGLHYLIVDRTLIVLAVAVLLAVLDILLLRGLERTPWHKMAH